MTATTKYEIGDRVEIVSGKLQQKTAFVKGFSKTGLLQLELEDSKNAFKKVTLSPEYVKICPLNTSEQTDSNTSGINNDDLTVDKEATANQESEDDNPSIPEESTHSTDTHDNTGLLPLLAPDEVKAEKISTISPYFKFTCKSTALSIALGQLIGIIKPMPIHPVLANVKFSVTSKNVELTAFDLRVGIITDLPVEAERSGTFTLGGRVLYSLLSLLPESDVTIEVSEEEYPMVQIKTSAGTYLLRGIAADEFPEIPFPSDKAQIVSLPVKQLAAGLASTLYAASTDETKQVLTGVQFIFDGTGNLEMASTDGHRLAKFCTCQPTNSDAKLDKFTIPSTALTTVRQFLSTKAEKLTITYDSLAENNLSFTVVQFTIDRTIVTTRILEGNYPDYKAFIPANFATEIWIDRATFMGIVKRASLVSEQKTYIVKIEFSKKDSTATISAESEYSSGTEVMPVQFSGDGDGIDIGFNIKYLSEAIAVMGTEEFAMKINAQTTPVICEPLNGDNVLALIMPVQIRK